LKLDATRPPDLLRRFVATPYVFMDPVGPNRCSVRSNDLEIALAVRGYWSNQKHESQPAVTSWLLIREASASGNSTDFSLLYTRELRTLMVGTKTILFYDIRRSELFGFVSSTITTQHLVSELIPRLLESENTDEGNKVPFTNK
jgi:hypothetical protein